MGDDGPMPGTVLLTGASAGIGRATADLLARQGWTVIGASRRGTGGEGWSGCTMDVDDDASVERAVAEAVERHGMIDAVVACAGFGIAGPSETTPLADARAQLETNFWGAVRVVHAVLPGMRARRQGRVVLVSSLGGLIALPFQSFYSASKFALEGWGEALAYDVAPFGIHVTLVEPGNVRTEFTGARRTLGLDGKAGAAYADAAHRAIDLMTHDELDGLDPTSVAEAVARALEARRPRRRVSVAPFDERVGIAAKRLLPMRAFEAAARSSLGV